MDRRTWLQLITILTAAREAQCAAARGSHSAARRWRRARWTRAGRMQNLPMRITKDQVVGALKLMGLEFQDAELDMMLRGVNQAISQLRDAAQGGRADRHRARLRIPSRLAGPAAHQGAATLRYHHSEDTRHEGAVESGRRRVLARGGSGAAAQVARQSLPPTSRRCTWRACRSTRPSCSA